MAAGNSLGRLALRGVSMRNSVAVPTIFARLSRAFHSSPPQRTDLDCAARKECGATSLISPLTRETQLVPAGGLDAAACMACDRG